MKTSLKSLALVTAIAFPCLAFSEFLGAQFFARLDGGALIGAFTIVVLGLISAADYSRRSRIALARARCGGSACCEINRLAA